MRGAWIETKRGAEGFIHNRSPLMRGAWIETLEVPILRKRIIWSPLMRGAWIETSAASRRSPGSRVAPHARGVD